MNFISSEQNQVIKEIKSLKEKKYRDKKGLYFIEGVRFIEEALKEKLAISKVLISDRLTEVKGGSNIINKLENEDICSVYKITNKLYMEITDTENPQGILAVLNKRSVSIESVYDNKNFFVVLDSIQDPGNMGTIIRTADAVGATAVIVSKGCVDIYNPKVLRSTMGSMFHIPICYCENLLQMLETLKDKGIRLCAAHLNGSKSHFELEYKNNIAIIIGNEANGISDGVAAVSDELVKIPMEGRSESLNASVAASLLMYEVLRNKMEL